jgi:hypothetical protein
MPLSAEREGTWVWLLSVGVGLLPLILRLCGNYVDSDHEAGLRELWNVDAFAKDLLLLCIVTCGLGLISLLSKHAILVHVRPAGTVRFPAIHKLLGIVFLLVFSAFFYGAAAAGHTNVIWPAVGLTVGTLIASLALEVASVAMAL